MIEYHYLRMNKYGEYTDIEYEGWDGEPVERTPVEWPYSYDAFFEWKGRDFERTDAAVYSDRLRQWDGKAFADAVHEVWPTNPGGQMFYGKNPKDVEKFLCLYFKKQVHLTGILRGCNVSNGYPYWIFAYREVAGV